jgi:hypothetical protein
MSKMYVVTGKLGSGKTLYTVKKAQDYLNEGRRVATNLDFNLSVLLGKKSNCKNMVRLPDQPTSESLENLGKAYNGSYDENKSGALILDECATWLNARDWNAKDRKGLTEIFVHIRKKGWDVYIIIQDISMLDKQIRKILAEHTVICRRMDRMKIPIIGFLFSLIGLENNLPKVHLASIFYGDFQGAPLVKSETYLGRSLYNAYDTRQIFDSENNGYYSLLPPIYYKKLSFVKWNLNKIMKLTQIYFRKYNIIFLMTTSACISAFLALTISSYYLDDLVHKRVVEQLETNDYQISETLTDEETIDETSKIKIETPLTLTQKYQIVGMMTFNDHAIYSLSHRINEGVLTDTRALESMGYKVKGRGFCEAILIEKSTGVVNKLNCL